jgi:hypothetical protein
MLHLTGEYGSLLIIQQRKERDISQNVWIAGHAVTLTCDFDGAISGKMKVCECCW